MSITSDWRRFKLPIYVPSLLGIPFEKYALERNSKLTTLTVVCQHDMIRKINIICNNMKHIWPHTKLATSGQWSGPISNIWCKLTCTRWNVWFDWPGYSDKQHNFRLPIRISMKTDYVFDWTPIICTNMTLYKHDEYSCVCWTLSLIWNSEFWTL